ncbi:natural killer cells antigen CD94-like [Myotis myotis]|uniref:natural killer cells antigen CD94-like n=1 Tax=Myotis myotis TaxID=51298 RepID=UPI00174EAF91|nr:natural killer cells antigen CD94-like [Myotis myotis]XP_036157688.1 natural killer cells antigen CD94-like [Myotis myotis]
MAAFQSTPWRLISGVLGVTCLVLMATLGIVLKNALTKQSIQPTPSPGPTTMEPQKGSGGYFCQEKWIGYQCKCYFISNEKKTWAESRNFCASQNSSLLQLKNKDDLQFIQYSRRFYWIGISYSDQHHAWLWEDGSAFSKDLFAFTERVNAGNCMMYNSPNTVLQEHCTDENYYICKKQHI